MKLEIESTLIEDKDFAQKNSKNGDRWFVRSQPMLMFKGDSKYPDKGSITLEFSDNENKRNSASTLPKGEYEIQESAYYFDKNGNMQLSFKPENLRLLTQSKAA